MKFSKHDMTMSCKKWIPLGFSVTAVFLFGYIAVQQSLRMSANDAPLDIAINIDQALSEGVSYKQFSSARPVDLGKSLSPYVILYDATGKPIAGSGAINGNYPVPPSGVFAYLRTHKEDSFTWEPEKGVRQAVVARYHDGEAPVFILAGHSLYEVEAHVAELTRLALVLWLVTMIGSYLLTLILS
jgi:hypothetical protein